MKSKLKYFNKAVFLLFALCISFGVYAQSSKDFDAKYLVAKQLLNSAKYIPAMEAFKPLMVVHKNNKNSVNACYFFANAAFYVKDYDAVLRGVKELQLQDPLWSKMDEANLLLIASHLAKNRYTQALNLSNKITNQSILKEVQNVQSQYIHSLLNVDTLLSLHTQFPNDLLINKLYGDYVLLKKKNENPDKFVVATVLPFSLNNLKLEASNRENQYVLDLYQGMKLAVDALISKGVKIDLRAYDIDKDTVKLLSLLNKPEFKSVDLLIGPIFNSQIATAAKTVSKLKIAVINPLSDNIKAVSKNNNALLFKSSLHTQAIKSAEFAYKNFEIKTALIIYGKSTRDTSFARVFSDKYKELGGKVFIYKQVDRFNSTNLTSLLGKDTLLNAGFVLACHSEQMVASNILTAVAIHNTKTPVITYSDWLDYTSINFDQFEKHNFYFVYPGFIDFENAGVQKFKNKYLETINVYPSEYAYWGYDLMMYYGILLKKFGPEFYTKLTEIPEIDGTLIEDHFYGSNQDNQLFSIFKFEKSKLIPLR